MTDAIKRRKGTTLEHATFAGKNAELTIDTTKHTAIIHDGSTLGGFPLAHETLDTSPVFSTTKGLVPGATPGDANKALFGDATWREVVLYVGQSSLGIHSDIRDPLPEDGIDGEHWINDATMMLFGPKANGVWPAGKSLVGPQGEKGDQGDQGEQGVPGETGVAGKTILYGMADPVVELGTDGDFYINRTTWMIFGPKVSGVWPAGVNIVGPQGERGPQGETGPQGNGLPVGGAVDQFLVKKSGVDYDYNWSNEVKGITFTGYAESINNIGDTQGAQEIDLALGGIHRFKATGAVTLTAKSLAPGKANTVTLVITNDGEFAITPFPGCKWPDGIAADFTAPGVSVYVFTTFDDGVTWLAMVAGQGFA